MIKYLNPITKILIMIIILLGPSTLLAANKYWIGPNNGSFNADTNWSTSSNGPNNTTRPDTNDIAIFDGGKNVNCIMDSNVSVSGIAINTGYTSIITQNNGVTLTVGNGNYMQNDGNFAGGDAAINMNGSMTINGGTFTSTSGTLSLAINFIHTSGGTFNHNNGTFIFTGNHGLIDVGAGGETFFNFNINKSADGNDVNLGDGVGNQPDSITVNGTFTCTNGELAVGTLNAKGAVNIAATCDGLDNTYPSTININGSSPQTVTLNAGGKSPKMSVTNAGATISTAGAGTFTFEDTYTHQNGVWNTTNIDINFQKGFSQNGGTFNASSANMFFGWNFTYTNGTFNHNNGTVTINSGGPINVSVPTNFNFRNFVINRNADNDAVAFSNGAPIINGTLTMTNGQINGTAEARGDVIVNNTFDDSNLTLTFGGTATQTFNLNGAENKFDGNITVNKTAGSVVLNSNFNSDTTNQSINIMDGDFDLNGFNFQANNAGNSFTVQNGANLILRGNEIFQINNSPSFLIGSTVVYNGGGTYASLAAGSNYQHLSFNGAGTYTLNSSLVVNGNLVINSGTLNSGGQPINVAGNWTNNGTFTHGNGSVNLNGTNQTIDGTTTFFNLTKTVNTSATLTIKNTTTISGTASLQGALGQLLNVNSDISGVQRQLKFTGSTSLKYLNVKDINNNNGGTAAQCKSACTNSGNNTNWDFTLATIQFNNSTSLSHANENLSNPAINLVLSNSILVPATVNYSVTAGTATGGGVDYTLANGTATINSGTNGGIPLIITNENLYESAETITITLSNPVNCTLGAATSYTYTIDNDDAQPSVSFTSVSQSSSAESGTITATLQLSSAAGANVSVPYLVSGTATGGGTDYSVAAGPATINSGATSTTIVISVASDTIDENDETVVLTLQTPLNATLGTTKTHTATIIDDDAAPTLSFSTVSDHTLESMTTFNVVVNLSQASSKSISANFNIVGGTAIGGGNDYTLSNTTLNFNPGDTSKSIPITITNDNIAESKDSIQLNLTNPTNATIGTGFFSYVIDNDDTNGVLISQSGNNTRVTEGSTLDTYTVSLASQPASDVTVTLSAGSELTASPSTLTFTSSNWSQIQTVTVRANDDAISEGNHTGTISTTVSSSDTAYNNISVNGISVNIVDNDQAGLDIEQIAGAVTTTENGTQGTYTVNLTTQPSGNVTVNISTDQQTTVSPTSLTFTSSNWNAPQTVTVSAVDDPAAEYYHSGNITHNYSSADSNYSGLPQTVIKANITDNDTGTVSIASGDIAATESGAPATYTVVLLKQPSSNVTITPKPDKQITVSPALLTFTTGNWNVPQTVTVSADNNEITEDIHYASVGHAISSSDSNFTLMEIRNVVLSINDPDIETEPDNGGEVDPGVPTNDPPTADAGLDRLVIAGNSVILNGSASTGTNITFNWYIESGAGTINNASDEISSITIPSSTTQGDTVVLLTVMDDQGQIDTDTVTINVRTNSYNHSSNVDQPPLVHSESGTVHLGQSNDGRVTLELSGANNKKVKIILPEDDADQYHVGLTNNGHAIISLPFANNGRGKVYISKKTLANLPSPIDLENISPNQLSNLFGSPIQGNAEGDEMGRHIATGDVDGDGIDEVWLSSKAGAQGVVYIYDYDGRNLKSTIFGSEDHPVWGVMIPNKFFATEFDDLFFGPDNETLTGELIRPDDMDESKMIAHPPLLQGYDGFSGTIDFDSDLPDLSFGDGDILFWSATFGDLNGDGERDLILGANNNTIWVYFGPGLPNGSLRESPDVIISGDDFGNLFGSMIRAGDLDGDGTDDLVIGDPTFGNNRQGALVVLFGSEGWDATIDASRGSNSVVIEGDPNEEIGADIELNDEDENGTDEIYTLAGNNTIRITFDETGDTTSSGNIYSLGGDGGGCSLNSSQNNRTPWLAMTILISLMILSKIRHMRPKHHL